MKKYFYSAVVALVALFTASCSQEESLVQSNTAPSKTTFSVALPTEKAITRAVDEGIHRYAMAIKGVDLVKGTETTGAMLIQSTGNFTVENLESGKKYTAYFWADEDAADATAPSYDITWPNYVKLNYDGNDTDGWTARPMKMAYCGTLEFTAGDAENYPITLKRAVSKVNLIQSAAGTTDAAKTITVSYSGHSIFDITGGKPADEAAALTQSFTIAAGQTAASTNIGTFLTFAPTLESELSTVTIKAGETTLATVNNVPFRANYQTNISGTYLSAAATAKFTVTTDDTWGTPDLEPGSAPAPANYITVAGVKWGKANSATTYAYANIPAFETNFRLPTETELTSLLNAKIYYGHHGEEWGFLFANEEISGYTLANRQADGTVGIWIDEGNPGNYSPVDNTFTDADVAKGIFIAPDKKGLWSSTASATTGQHKVLYVAWTWIGIMDADDTNAADYYVRSVYTGE